MLSGMVGKTRYYKFWLVFMMTEKSHKLHLVLSRIHHSSSTGRISRGAIVWKGIWWVLEKSSLSWLQTALWKKAGNSVMKGSACDLARWGTGKVICRDGELLASSHTTLVSLKGTFPALGKCRASSFLLLTFFLFHLTDVQKFPFTLSALVPKDNCTVCFSTVILNENWDSIFNTQHGCTTCGKIKVWEAGLAGMERLSWGAVPKHGSAPAGGSLGPKQGSAVKHSVQTQPLTHIFS